MAKYVTAIRTAEGSPSGVPINHYDALLLPGLLQAHPRSQLPPPVSRFPMMAACMVLASQDALLDLLLQGLTL